jgi:hypothetical protein
MANTQLRDDIIRMAREAGAGGHEGYDVLYHTFSPESLERFFHMAQAAEREACAKLVDLESKLIGKELQSAAAIRARGQE